MSVGAPRKPASGPEVPGRPGIGPGPGPEHDRGRPGKRPSQETPLLRMPLLDRSADTPQADLPPDPGRPEFPQSNSSWNLGSPAGGASRAPRRSDAPHGAAVPRRPSGEHPPVSGPITAPPVAFPIAADLRIVDERRSHSLRAIEEQRSPSLHAIEEHLLTLFPSADPVLQQMERLAAEQSFPIAGPLLGRFLRQMAQTISARDVFEMGSGFGYSTYFLAQAVGDGGRVVHTDFDAGRSQLARLLLAQGGLQDRVTFEVGDAVELIANYPGPFDLIFIDIDKERYSEALDLARARVRPGGYIITDGLLGSVRAMEGVPGNQATAGVRRYLKAALSAPDLFTTVLPLSDGVGLHLKGVEQRKRR